MLTLTLCAGRTGVLRPLVRGVCLALVVAGASGCATRQSGIAAASVIDVCTGYEEYQKTREPDVTKAVEVSRFAADIEHLSLAVDTRLKAPNGKIPLRLQGELRSLGAAARQLRLKADSGNRAALNSALSAYANDTSAQLAERDFSLIYQRLCPSGPVVKP